MLGTSGSRAAGTPDPVPATRERRAVLTVASSSNLPKSSFSSFTSSCAVHCDARPVKPTMSAKRMLRDRGHCLRGLREPPSQASPNPPPVHSSPQLSSPHFTGEKTGPAEATDSAWPEGRDAAAALLSPPRHARAAPRAPEPPPFLCPADSRS